MNSKENVQMRSFRRSSLPYFQSFTPYSTAPSKKLKTLYGRIGNRSKTKPPAICVKNTPAVYSTAM